jgi:hypothetical protein
MIDLTTVSHHPAIEELVDVLCNKTQNTDRGFFRVEVAYFLAKMAGTMRASILTEDRGEIPVNVYALALGTSGYGKGHSVHIIENQFMSGFKRRFMEDTFNVISDGHLWKMALERAAISGKEEQAEKDSLDKEFIQAGNFTFTFDSGTAPAVKQLRHKLLMADVGAINLQIDEIGSNLVGNTEVLNVFLELYDQGMVNNKLTKNTTENVRGREIDGKTPTNALLFGTPSKLLDGGIVEDNFYSFLDTGYARRCLFGWGQEQRNTDDATPAEIYARLVSGTNKTTTTKWSTHFSLLADPAKFGWEMTVDDVVGIELLTYKIECERHAATYPEHEEIRKAEMSHRYFKALKLAGALAFVDESSEIEMDHLHAAMKLVEESGESFQRLMTREKTYVKLAKYIAATKEDLTHADLFEALPFYKASQTARTEIMTLATAWGYKQNIIIQKTFVDGIEFFRGSTLEETNLDEILITYSDHFAYNYVTERAPFASLHELTQAPGMNWTNHGFQDGHRLEEKVIPGFNMIAIDVDGGVDMEQVHELMKDYTFMTYTTKSHTDGDHRFRLMIPISYVLELDYDDYKEFMNSFMEWLPFTSDEGANQRSKKWETYAGGTYHSNEGLLLDPLRFVPKTTKNEQHRESMGQLESLDNLERWFAGRIASGNRNNQMIKFAYALVDSGMTLHEVEQNVIAFNQKLSNGLTEQELRSTIFQSVAKRYD